MAIPIRTDIPYNSPFYNNYNNGGYSWCIDGSPAHYDCGCNVLSNCVGYSCGRFNELYSVLTGYAGMKFPELCCNAEDFIEVAQNLGLEIGMEPREGAIMVWGGEGELAGHVENVEIVYDAGHVFTSASGWDSPIFWNSERWNDGNWGAGWGYWFRGFIYNPAVGGGTIITPVSRDIYRDQIQNKAEDANVRDSASISANVLGIAPQGMYNIISTAEADGYTWYQVEAGKWLAGGEWIEFFKAEERPSEAIYRVRDDNYYVWFPDVVNDSDYAGLYGDAVSGFQLNITKGNVRYAASVKDYGWLPFVANREDYAGSEYRGQNIDALCIYSDVPLAYRVHILGGDWLPWVDSRNADISNPDAGFAGIIGSVIDGVQVKLA